ncbi:MAG: hypothetical protein RLZZ230_781 [Candidatus Parcubacteria bacterium]|jgi:hypothetical protein
MNEDTQTVSTPNFEGEPMKMPENVDAQPVVTSNESNIVNGPLLLTLTILLIIILGGMYYWFSTLNIAPEVPAPTIERPSAEANNEPESTTAEAQAAMLLVTSPSDELPAIEADLSVEMDGLDAELNAIDTEIDAAVQP